MSSLSPTLAIVGFAPSLAVVAFGGGVASFFAPCVFPLLPGYVGYYVGEVDDERPLGGALLRGLAASGGILAVFAALGLVVVSVGRALVNYVRFFEPVVGLALVVVGVAMLSGRSIGRTLPLPGRRTSVPGFVLFGAGYAVAAMGCMAGVFAAVVVEATTASVLGSGLAVLAYAAGLAVPLVAATVVIAVGHDAVRSLQEYTGRVERLAGALVAVAGGVQCYRALELLL